MSPLPPTLMIVVTSAMMMLSAVNCYDDHSGYCAGPEYVCRHSQSMLPEGRTDQLNIDLTFHEYAFSSPAVCRRLENLNKDMNFNVYAYFSCSLDHCFNCYDDAFGHLLNTDVCSGKDGGFISLDGCCLRYEKYDFCGAPN